MFPLLRYFSLMSGGVIGLATILVVFSFYLHEINQLVENGEKQNIRVAKLLANAVEREIVATTDIPADANLDHDSLANRAATKQLHQTLSSIVKGLPILKVKLYNLNGLTVYSSQTSQIGEDKNTHPGFNAAATEGKPTSKLSHREEFYSFNGVVIDREVVETYLPVKFDKQKVGAVFELYFDATADSDRVKRESTLAVILLLAVFALVYSGIFFIVRRANSILCQQYAQIEQNEETVRLQNVALEKEVVRRQDAQNRSDLEHQRLIDATDSFTGGFILYDKDDRMVICNDSYLKAMADVADILKPGVTFEEVLRVRNENVKYKNGSKRGEKWIQERLEKHRNPKGPIELTIEDGDTFQLHEFKTREGGTVLIRTDITDLKNSERELISARHEAETANRSKSEFLANMSHELRTPLNAIIGFADAIKTEMFGPLDNEKYREYVNDIQLSGNHLLNLINDVLDMSVIEAGKLILNEIAVNLEDTVDASVQMVKSRAEFGKVELINSVDGEAPIIRADELRIKQVLVNLLSNAIKFTPVGGTVSVNTGIADDSSALIIVTDTGIGMDTTELARAMEKFGQTERGNLMQNHDGTGLGLPLTRALVEAHGGTLEIYSEPDKGTTVTVRLPQERVINEISNPLS